MKGAVSTATVFGFKKIKFIETKKLKPHEKINTARLAEVINSIKKKKTLFFPVVIEKSNLVILDGHHRVQAFKLLGIKKIPCFLVNYFSDEIKLFGRRNLIKVNKKTVVERALTENLFPCKTTKHVLELFRINYKIGGAKMHKINEIKKTGGNKMKKELTELKTKNFDEGRHLWRNKFVC